PPFGRYGGTLAVIRTDDLAAIPIKALVERNPKVDWNALDDVVYGCANQAGEDNRNVGRMALLLAGLPKEVPGTTVNRLCGSSMDAVAIASRAIKSAEDEHPRPDTTLEALSKLKPIVKPDGTITAGNASGVNDGACALLLASEAAVKRHGLSPKARVVASAAAGVAPRVMGMGPAPATRKVLAKAGLQLSQMDVLELNE